MDNLFHHFKWVWKAWIALAFVAIAVPVTSCHKNSATPVIAVPKGLRNLGLHVTTASGQDYASAFAFAQSAGMDCVPVTLQWTALEVNNHYDPEQILESLNLYFPLKQMPVSLCISPIVATNRDLPADLMNKAFDDPAMINRFKRLLDTVYKKTSAADVRYLLIGNEVDLYFSGHTSEWAAYTRFCAAVRLHAKSLWGNKLPAGAETTLGAALTTDKEAIKQLNLQMDMVCFTYYPLNDDFTMQPMSEVSKNIEALLAFYAERKVFMEECGYATSSVCKGSEALQEQFVREVFRLWDKYPERFLFVGFLWLHDLSAAQAQQVTIDYGLSGSPAAEAFTEYVRSLGLRNYDGTSKTAFTTLQQEASLRGWK